MGVQLCDILHPQAVLEVIRRIPRTKLQQFCDKLVRNIIEAQNPLNGVEPDIIIIHKEE